jgi:hypothetical protein
MRPRISATSFFCSGEVWPSRLSVGVAQHLLPFGVLQPRIIVGHMDAVGGEGMRAARRHRRLQRTAFGRRLGQAILVWFCIGIPVMRGLDPRIHQKKAFLKQMDCRVKPGNDGKRLAPLYRVGSANCQKGSAASLLAAGLYG